jgi:Protein of unknown function (DUF4238)
MADAKRHHYVPQFLLRNFAASNGSQIHAFDKTNGKSYCTNIANVAAENRLYEFEFEGMIATAEPSLADFESKVSPVVRKVLENDNLGCLGVEEAFLLGAFVAMQFVRSPHLRAMRNGMLTMMREQIKEIGGDPDKMPELQLLDENQQKMLDIRMLRKSNEFIPTIMAKTWVLHTIPEPMRIHISDNPVAMHNVKDLRPFGNLGLAVEGVEVYLPLSASRCLAMYCPTVMEEHRARLRRYATLSRDTPLPPRLEEGRAKADAWLSALQSGTPVAMTSAGIELVNALQVWNAERFVYGSTDDFAMAREMIAGNEELRKGPRLR